MTDPVYLEAQRRKIEVFTNRQVQTILERVGNQGRGDRKSQMRNKGKREMKRRDIE